MKKLLFVFLILVINVVYGQKSSDWVYISNNNRFEIIDGICFGKVVFDTIKEKNGSFSVGNLAIDGNGEKSKIRVGLWKEFYKNKTLKAIGEYRIGSYIQCCTMGPCREFYNYKHGKWQYCYENGRLEAEGIYSIEPKHLNTSCQGGDNANCHKINDKWKFWDKEGKIIKVNNELKDNLEMINFQE